MLKGATMCVNAIITTSFSGKKSEIKHFPPMLKSVDMYGHFKELLLFDKWTPKHKWQRNVLSHKNILLATPNISWFTQSKEASPVRVIIDFPLLLSTWWCPVVLFCTFGYFAVLGGTWGYTLVNGVLWSTLGYFGVLWGTCGYLGLLGGTWGYLGGT